MRTRGVVIGARCTRSIAVIGGAATLALAAIACSTADVRFTRAPDAAGTHDGAVGFAPLHIRSGTLLSRFADLTLSADPTTIDTTGLTINSTASSYFVQYTDDDGDLYAVLFANALTVRKPVKVIGALSLIIVATGPVAILADIDLSASGSSGGPGAVSSGSGLGGPGGTDLIDNGFVRLSSGGGGGGHGSRGGTAGSIAAVSGGAGGLTYGDTPAEPLIGGTAGGPGGHTTVGGGVGGGALQISSGDSITISSAVIAASGGGGAGGDLLNGGGGGGAGGEILLEAPTIAVVGVLAANGGGGGGGGADSPTGMVNQLPTDGDPGGAGILPAAGGRAGLPGGTHGAAGAAGIAGAFSEAEPGGCGNQKCGGSGGGAGRIWLRFRPATPPDLGNAIISPPPGLDPTVP